MGRFGQKRLEEQEAVTYGGTLSGRRAAKAAQIGHVGDDRKVYKGGKKVKKIANTVRDTPQTKKQTKKEGKGR